LASGDKGTIGDSGTKGSSGADCKAIDVSRYTF